MSSLGGSDDRMHYSDGSHRWIPADPRIAQDTWEIEVATHKEQHRKGLDRPVRRRESCSEEH